MAASSPSDGSASASPPCKVLDSHLHVWASPQQVSEEARRAKFRLPDGGVGGLILLRWL